MLNKQAVWIFLLLQQSRFALTSPPPLSVASGSEPSIFGLQDALNENFGSTNGAITVFLDDCTLANGTQDCTAVCQNSTQMFGNLTTLHNCVVYSKISIHRSNNSLTDEARILADELNIEAGNNGSLIFNDIQSCLFDSCNDNSNCTGRFENTSAPPFIALCGSFPHHASADVAGIGVFISYVMQMGLALLAFVLTIPWSPIIKRLPTSVVSTIRALSLLRGSSKTMQHDQPPSAQSSKKYSDAVKKALEDFQKAQCFFMLATNIASLVAEKRGDLDPSSLQELYDDYVFIKVIAIGGYLPITFTLLNLHMIKNLSWYLLTLSAVTIAVATTTLKSGNSTFAPTPKDFDDIKRAAAAAPGPSSCGHQNLLPWCYKPRQKGHYFGFNTSSTGSGANEILVLCLITLIIVIVDHFCRSDNSYQQNLNRRILKKLDIAPSEPLFPYADLVLRFGTMTFHFVFFCLHIYGFYVFGVDLEWFRTNKIYDPKWTFGQIVAILVWAPTLCDYLWENIHFVDPQRKVEEGTQTESSLYRLMTIGSSSSGA